MAAIGSIIETGVDKLVRLVKERARISMEDAAKELGLSLTVVEEWADFLEEEGIISIEYKFTKPFLVEKKLTKTEVEKKEKEFTGKKEIFVRKAEGTLSFLERESTKLKSIKAEFDKLKNEFGLEIGTVKNDIAQLEKYQQQKTELDRQIQQQKSEAQKKINEMTQKIIREQKRYQEILTEINKEEEKLKKEKNVVLSIEESEKILKKRLAKSKEIMNKIEKKMSGEDLEIKNSEEHIENLRNLTDSIKQNLEKGKVSYEPLIKKGQEQKLKIQQLESEILSKITKSEGKIEIVKKTADKLKKFFDKKMWVVGLVDKVNKDRDDLEKELIGLIKKAKSFQLTSKSVDIGKQMADIEKKFKEVDKRKDIFENEFKRLNMMVKKKTTRRNPKKTVKKRNR